MEMIHYNLKYILSTFIVTLIMGSCSLFRPSPQKLYMRALKNEPYDVIIVPGVPFNGKEWDYTMEGRVKWGVYLYKKGITKNIIFSGGSVYSPYVEAKIMALYAEALGVAKENIFVEAKAEHSTENFYYSYHLAKELGFTKIALATDPYQSKKLTRFTKTRFKLPVGLIPIVNDTLSAAHLVSPTINPESAHVDNFKSIVDTQTKWHRLKGTLGLNIKFEKE